MPGYGPGAGRAAQLQPPTAGPVTVTSAGTHLTWAPPSAGPIPGGYVVTRDGAAVCTTNTAACDDTNLAPGKSYTYLVSSTAGSYWVSATSLTMSATDSGGWLHALRGEPIHRHCRRRADLHRVSDVRQQHHRHRVRRGTPTHRHLLGSDQSGRQRVRRAGHPDIRGRRRHQGRHHGVRLGRADADRLRRLPQRQPRDHRHPVRVHAGVDQRHGYCRRVLPQRTRVDPLLASRCPLE